MEETQSRRASRRWRTILKGQVVFNNRASVLDCTVRDLSDTGARITFPDTLELPSEFELDIPNKGLRLQARLMWSRGATHGVMFIQEQKVWTDPTHAKP